MVTVTEAVAPQLLVKVIVAVPADWPATRPDAALTVAIPLLLLHTPPVAAEVVASKEFEPAHIVVLPVIGATIVGNTVTVKVLIVVLLLGSAAVTVTVVVPTGNTLP